MSDRLTELRCQRALAQEQVAWFDREIAREAGAVPAPVTPTMPATPAPTGTPADPAPADAERLIEKYQSSPGSLQSEVRRGCFLYFFAALALVALGACVLWFLFRR